MSFEYLPYWPFEPDWDSGITESLEWFTNILTSKTGAEQRLAHRDTPRRMIEMDLLYKAEERLMVEKFIAKMGGGQFYIPLYFDRYETTADAISGESDVFMDTTNMLLGVGDVIGIYPENSLAMGMHEIISFTGTKLVVEPALWLDYPAGSTIMKLSRAQFIDQVSLDELGTDVITGSIKVLVMDSNPLNIQTPTTFGPLINSGTSYVSHSYHDLSDPTGRTEEQFMMAGAMLAAYDVLKDEPGYDFDEAARYYKDLGLSILDAIGDGEDHVPIHRAWPDTLYGVSLPHYRFAARSNAPIMVTQYDEMFTVNEDNSLFIPDANQLEVPPERIWKIYPTTAELFIERPWMPAYDYATPTVNMAVNIVDWSYTEDGIEIPIPIGAPDEIDDWNVVYTYENGDAVDIGDAFKLLPGIERVRSKTAIYSGEIMRWAEKALSRAHAIDDRDSGIGEIWDHFRTVYTRGDIAARQVFGDQRWIFRRMSDLIDALPSLDDVPKGFFCYSDHPEASAPIGTFGLDAEWTGYNFWSRDTSGDLIADVPVPGQLSRVQFGRRFSDQWRQAETYQFADQYLYVSLYCTRKPVLANGEYFLVWASSKQDDTEEDRWFADIGSKSAFVATAMDTEETIDFLIPITDFKRRSYNGAGVSVWGSTMPAGQILKSFGISAEFNNNIGIRLREMRLVSGTSSAWVTANLEKAKKGYPMPYYPGAVVSQSTLHVDQQEFEQEETFSPLHGFQYPAFWKIFEGDTNDLWFNGLAPGDLPVPSLTTNLITYPITATTSVGSVTKTPAALLMEQQLLFLDHAQKEYQADGGSLGPFAHTYTMNTYDRFLFSDKAHSKWVYENFRPYTQWGGFQYRVAEALAQTIDSVGSTAEYSDAKTLASTNLVNFMNWLNGDWPNLTGVWAGFDGVRVFSGDEADYAKRFSGDENPFLETYEDTPT